MFRPKNELAVWRQAYQQLLGEGVDYGKEFSHEYLASLFGAPVAEFLRRRGPLYRLMAELESEHGRTLVPVAGRGYRVSHPAEHAGLCLDRKRRGRRQMRRAVNLIDATDGGELTAEGVEELRKVKCGLVVVLGVLSVHERRLNRIEEALRAGGLL